MPLRIIYGNDPLACKEALAALIASLDADGSLATNTVTFEARSAAPQEVIAACSTVPFLGEHRLVVLEGVLEQTSRGKRGAKRAPVPAEAEETEDREEPEAADATPWEMLAAYIPDMPPTTTLVLLDGAVPEGGKLLKTLAPLGKAEKHNVPADKELGPWLAARARTIGLKLDARAARLLAEMIGSDPYALASELDKLAAYAAGAVVREEDVRELVSRVKEHKGWELSDAVFKGESARAARLLYELIEDGQHPQPLLSTVASRYRRTAIAKDMLERGESGGAVQRRMNLKDNALRYVIDEAERTSWDVIRRAYARLIEAELDVKRGLMDRNEVLALELAVQELAAGKGSPAGSRSQSEQT